MSEKDNVVSILDSYIVGKPIGSHYGISCSPALKKENEQKYILKKMSIPQSQTQVDALLITGAYKDSLSAKNYFRIQADEIAMEIAFLQKMSRMGSFTPFEEYQIVPKEKNLPGFEVYMLSSFRYSLEKYIVSGEVTHLDAVNLGIDICGALTACRKEGMMYINLKPSNIFVSPQKDFKIGDIGFAPMKSLKFFFMQDKYRSAYTAPEMQDDMAQLNESIDTYALGMILYQLFNNGKLPADKLNLVPPVNGDDQIRRIIMKAIDPDPAKRWRDPGQMGQVLVLYMQRNTINNTPIMDAPVMAVPESAEEPTVEEPAEEVQIESISAAEEPVPEVEAEEPPKAETATQEETPVQEEHAEEAVPAAAEPEVLPSDEPESSSDPQDDPELSVILSQDTMQIHDLKELSSLRSHPVVPAASDDHFDYTLRIAPTAEQGEEPVAEDIPDDVIPVNLSFEEAEAELPDGSTLPEIIEEPVIPVPAEPALIAVPSDIVFPDKPTADVSDESFDQELAEVASLLDSKPRKDSPVSKAKTPAPQIEPKKDTPSKKVKKQNSDKLHKFLSRLLLTLIILLFLGAAGITGYLYYQNGYLQHVDYILVEGSPEELTVSVFTDIDDSLLSVSCSNPYGITIREPVHDGKAVFTNLSAGVLYNIEVEVSGLHKLTGQYTDIYTSEAYTNIVNLSAISGAEDGSALLNLTVEGTEPASWLLEYTSEGEEVRQQTFTGHAVAVSGLTVGKEYTFRVSTSDESNLLGQTTVNFLAVKPVLAKNLAVRSADNGTLVVTWDAPLGENVDSWKAHCYGDGYDETLELTETIASFPGIDVQNSYNVEVIADGMTTGERITIPANPIMVISHMIDESAMDHIGIGWEYNGPDPDGGWTVMYTVGDSEDAIIAQTNIPFITLNPRIPGVRYNIDVQSANGTFVIGGKFSYTCPNAEMYIGHGFSSYALSARLLPTPDNENWNYFNTPDSNFTDTFKAGADISMVLRSSSNFYLDNVDFTLTFIFKDADGNPIPKLSSSEVRNWAHLWSGYDYHYADLHVGTAPEVPGVYTIETYLDGMLATTNTITVS